MKAGNFIFQTPNHRDKSFDSLFICDTPRIPLHPQYMMVLVYSGELLIAQGNKDVSTKCGEYVFMKYDNKTVITKNNCGENKFRGVFMIFRHSFLLKFYSNLDKRKIPALGETFDSDIIKLPQTPYIQSLYLSMVPYFNWKTNLSFSLMELKLQEGIYNLLLMDDRFYWRLFDFINPDEVNLLYFIKENCIHNLSTNTYIEKGN